LLAKAAVDAGREADSTKLLAVSKKQPISRVLEAIEAGQRDFGENLVAEGVEKIELLANDALVWHFIGHLQTNKTRVVAEHFDWVHSVDRFKTARRLSEQRPASMGDLNICIQVNVDAESSKSGVAPDKLEDLATQVVELPGLRLRGLMCLPRIRTDFDSQREPFARLRELTGILRAAGIDTDTLSMGMSADFRAAIFEGSTIVRIGTAVFGPRNTA
jgi:pyridoxal phosphate enzyme (YggS family)